MVFLRRICSSRPGDGEQRGQSLAALTARGRGLDCLQPQLRQPVLRRNKLRIFRFRASAKAQSLRLFLLSPQSGHFVGKGETNGAIELSRLRGSERYAVCFDARQAAVAGVASSQDPFHEL